MSTVFRGIPSWMKTDVRIASLTEIHRTHNELSHPVDRSEVDDVADNVETRPSEAIDLERMLLDQLLHRRADPLLVRLKRSRRREQSLSERGLAGVGAAQ